MSWPTLTRRAEVIEVLRAGGTVHRQPGHTAILILRNAQGQTVNAWQQAIAAAALQLSVTPQED